MTYRCETIAATAQIRVYQARTRRPAREEAFQSSFARWLRTGRVTPLGDNVKTTTVLELKRLALSGRFVADAMETCGKNECGGWSISRVNAQTGRNEEATVSTATSELENPNQHCVGAVPPGAPGVTDLIVTAKGTVAWIIGGSIEGPTNLKNLGSRTVCELPPRSKTPLVVASSPKIEPRALAANGGHLYWLEGGVARTTGVQ